MPIRAHIRQGHLVAAYTQQREHGLLTVAEVAHPYDPHGVLAKLGIQIHQVRTARGTPALAFTTTVPYAHQRIFQALKQDRTMWGDSQALGRFAWLTFPDRMPRVLAAFRADQPEPAQPDPAVLAVPAAPPARPPMPSWTAPAKPAAAPPPAAPIPAPAPPPPAPLAPRPPGPAPSGNWATLSLEDALRVQPPTPTQGPPPEIAGKLIGDQAKDVGLIMDAMQRGEEAFLLGNSTGTGKTYVAAATLATVKPSRALVVVMNQGLVSQWTEDASNFGVEIKRGDTNFSTGPGIYGITYAGLDKLVKTQGLDALGRFDLVIYDEPHMQIMKRGTRGKLADDVSGRGRFSLYMTATPAEEPQQMQYLSRLNLWRRFTGGEQRRWMEAHGVRLRAPAHLHGADHREEGLPGDRAPEDRAHGAAPGRDRRTGQGRLPGTRGGQVDRATHLEVPHYVGPEPLHRPGDPGARRARESPEAIDLRCGQGQHREAPP